MSNSIFGEVIKVRKFRNGDIEIDFHHDEQITQYRYSDDFDLKEEDIWPLDERPCNEEEE